MAEAIRVADFDRRLRFSLTPEHVLFLYGSPDADFMPWRCPRIGQELGAGQEANRVVDARKSRLRDFTRPICVHGEKSVELGGIREQFEGAKSNRLELGDNGVGNRALEVTVSLAVELGFQ